MAKGLKNADRYARNLGRFFDSKYFTKAKKQLAEEAEKDIVRTAKSADVLQTPYPKYSKAYNNRKAKNYPGMPWLTATGEGLGTPSKPKHFMHKVTRNKITITYDGPDYMIYHQKGKGKQPRRQWFGLGRTSTIKGIMKTIRLALKATANAVNSGKRI